MNEFSLAGVKAGDEVIIEDRSRRRDAPEVRRCKVEKVGRTLLYVKVNDWGSTVPFYIETGHENWPSNRGGQSSFRAFTEETHARMLRRRAAEEIISPWRRSLGGGIELTTEQLERIAAVLTEARASQVT